MLDGIYFLQETGTYTQNYFRCGYNNGLVIMFLKKGHNGFVQYRSEGDSGSYSQADEAFYFRALQRASIGGLASD